MAVAAAVVPPPSITSFTAAQATVTAGTGTTLSAVFTGGTGSLNQGLGAIISNQPLATGNLLAATTYTLTVSNALGQSVTAQLALAVIPAPSITSFSAARSILTTGTGTTLSAVFTGGTASVDQGLGAMPGNGPLATGNLSASTTYTLTVSNTAGSSVQAQCFISAVAPPAITRFAAVPASLGPGGTSSLVAEYSGGTGIVGPAIGNLGSGAQTSTGALNASQTFTLTVTNPAGSTVSSQVRVLVGSLATWSGVPAGAGNLDGTGAQARFNGPGGMAFDPNGNLLVVDSANGTIRKITTSGNVTTFVGDTTANQGFRNGTGTQAQFGYPMCLALDAAGNAYVTDYGSSTIRMVSPLGVVTTFAGQPFVRGSANGPSGSATFDQPSGIALDRAGNVYVADTATNTIRKITPGGTVTTLAGTAGTSGCVNGIGSEASFNTPVALAADGNGNLYVADAGNQTVRMISPTGAVSTLAGNTHQAGTLDGTGAAASFSGTWGIAIDGNGNILVSDNCCIRSITPEGVVTTPVGSADPSGSADGTGALARFWAPSGLACDGLGNTFVADLGNNLIRKIAPGAVVTTLAGTASFPGSTEGPVQSATFSSPGQITYDLAGNLYLVDQGNAILRKITPSGAVTAVAGSLLQEFPPFSPTQLSSILPTALALDQAGNIYVAYIDSTIRKITPDGSATLLAGSPWQTGSADGPGPDARFNNPMGLVCDVAGNLYVVDTYNATIRKITPAGKVSTFAGSAGTATERDGAGASASFYFPLGIAMDAQGNLYVTDYMTLRKITADATVTTLAGCFNLVGQADGTGADARFDLLTTVTVAGDGTLYVTDGWADTIRRITPQGVVDTVVGVPYQASNVPGPLPALLSAPSGIALDPSTGTLAISLRDAILKANF